VSWANEEACNRRQFDLIDELCDERYSNPFGLVRSRGELKAGLNRLVADPGPVNTVTILDTVAVRLRYTDGREQLTLHSFAKGEIIEDRYYSQGEPPK